MSDSDPVKPEDKKILAGEIPKADPPKTTKPDTIDKLGIFKEAEVPPTNPTSADAPTSTKPNEDIPHIELPQQSQLPSEVLAAQKIDRDNYRRSQGLLPENTNTSVGTTQNEDKNKGVVPTTGSFKDKLLIKLKALLSNESNAVKIALIIPIIMVVIFVIFGIMYLANIDTVLFKITMQGTIKDGLTQQPISFAKIYIEDEEKATTNNLGSYQINNLNPQISDVKIVADGYDEYKQEIAITRGFLAYTIRQDFVLTSSEKAIVTGKFISNDTKYNFSSDKLFINDKEHRITADGSFEITGVTTGTMNFKFTSMSFKDVSKTYSITTGNNKLQDIVLEPAGDITGELKSYVSEDLVLGTQFNIENVTANQVELKGDGNFVIKDLDISKKYKIKVLATGYKTRDYEIDIKQGENKLFDFKLVEDYMAAFLKKTGSGVNDYQLFTSDLDGINSKQVTTLNQFNPFGWYLNVSENQLYILSSHERVQSLKSNTRLAYSLDTNTDQLQSLTTNRTGLGDVYSSFRSKKLINITSERVNNNTNRVKLEVMDLAGNNRQEIRTLNNAEISSAFISDSGNYIFFYQNDTNATGYFRVDINSKDAKSISPVADSAPYDATNNGEKTIFSRKNSATGFNDLTLYTFQSNESRILDENLDGKDYQFIKGSDDQIIYFANRNGRSNIFKFTISQNKDEKITDLGAEYTISDIYQNGKFVFYSTNRGLFVLDITNPKSLKLVTKDAA